MLTLPEARRSGELMRSRFNGEEGGDRARGSGDDALRLESRFILLELRGVRLSPVSTWFFWAPSHALALILVSRPVIVSASDCADRCRTV